MTPPPPWDLPDDKLLAECRLDSFVGTGPGGQKRHKTNAAVRLTHLPTRISTVAADSRSHRENHIHALRQLRHKLALEIRHDVELLSFHPPQWFGDYPGLHINPKNPLYPAAMAIVLDVLKASTWAIAKAAVNLGLTTSALTRFLYDDPALWQHVNKCRAELGIKPLRRD